jgi:MazG family protein
MSPTPLEKEAQVRAPDAPLERVLAMARLLRGPEGCPWDGQQTLETLTPYLQEEAFEVVEAIGSGNPEAFREELGDLLFLVLFTAVVGEDQGRGTLGQVADGVIDKLVRRHPHVFAESRDLPAGDAIRQWEEIKREEIGTKGVASSLGRRPAGLPALTTAYRVSEKAGAVGFQWPDVSGALDKLEEEMRELRREVKEGASERALEEELGDVLYSVVNLARYLRIDPERALRATTAKFMRRFAYMEERLAERGTTPSGSTLEEMDRLWNEAKRSESG